jgi:hypothetical protein
VKWPEIVVQFELSSFGFDGFDGIESNKHFQEISIRIRVVASQTHRVEPFCAT